MIILPANTLSGGYEVANSCMFNDDDSPHLHKTNSGAGNRDTFTFSTWVKRGTLGTEQRIFSSANTSGTNAYGALQFHGTYDDLIMFHYDGSSNYSYHRTNRQFKDPSAWYHICIAVDTTQSTASNRVKIYINGSQETSFRTETTPNQNTDMQWNTAEKHWVGAGDNDSGGQSRFFDGYLAETVFIDGLQLAPTSFGEFDEDTPSVFKPIDVSGLTFGTNGFYLDYEDSGTLGNDANGETDFTSSGLAATDQASDSPTNNFCTWNGVDYNGDTVLAEGNTEGFASSADDYHQGARGTMAVSSGKWYWEVKVVEVGDTSNIVIAGIMSADHSFRKDEEDELLVGTYGMRSSDGKSVISSGSALAYATWGAAFVDGDILNFALDMDNNRLYIGKGGSWADGSGNIDEASINAYLSLSTTPSAYMPMVIGYSTGAAIKYQANFGNAPYSISSGNADANGYGNFEYAVPSGYYALNTKNLAEYGG